MGEVSAVSFDFVRKMSLRRQILWGTQLFTAVVSLLVGVVLFALSDSYIRTTTLRSVEFNLQQMSASVQTDLDTARSLLNWASTDSTLRRYLTAGQMNGLLTTSAYETFSDRYLSSRLQTRIVRFFVTNGENRFLQQGSLTSSAGLNADTVALFDGPENTLTFAEDPLLPSHPTCLVLRREIRPDSETSYTGWIYLGLDTAVITGAADRYIMPDGGVLYWRMGDQIWRLDGRLLTLVKNGLALEPCDVSGMASPATSVSRITRNGRPFILNTTEADYRPLVQVIDNVERNHKLGLVIEACIGPGRLLMCTVNLDAVAGTPEGQQFRTALLRYMKSEQFAPSTDWTWEEWKALLTAVPNSRDITGVKNESDYAHPDKE